MPRSRIGSLPSYRLHKSSGQAVVTIGGRDHYLGVFDTKESKSEYARLLVLFVNGESVVKPVATETDESIAVLEVLNAYWKFAQGYYLKNGKPTDEQKAVKKVIRDVKAVCGDLLADEIGPKVLKAIRQIWITQGLCRGYINQNTGRIRRIFKWAVSEEMVCPAIMEGLRAVSGLRKGRSLARETSPVLPVAIDVVERTIPHLSSVVADMIRLQLLTGMRPGEVCNLRPRDVDRTNDVWEYHVDGHKMEHHGRTRIVFVGPDAQAMLAPYLLRDANQFSFSPHESIADLRERRNRNRTTPERYGNGRRLTGRRLALAARCDRSEFLSLWSVAPALLIMKGSKMSASWSSHASDLATIARQIEGIAVA